MLYRDRKELRAGDVHAVALRVRGRARKQLWLGALFGAFLVLQGVLSLLDMAAGENPFTLGFDLIFGALAVVFGLLLAVFWTRESTRIESRATLALELLNAEDQA